MELSNSNGIKIINGSYDELQVYIASKIKKYYTKFLGSNKFSITLIIYTRKSLFGDKYKFTIESNGESVTFPSNDNEFAELYQIMRHIS
jgi:hypothetical protein